MRRHFLFMRKLTIQANAKGLAYENLPSNPSLINAKACKQQNPQTAGAKATGGTNENNPIHNDTYA